MTDPRKRRRPQTLAGSAVVPWLTQPVWTIDELTRLLHGLALPAIGHESPSWYWILDALRSADDPRAAREELASRVAQWLIERPTPWIRAIDPAETLFNALNIAVSDPQPALYTPALRALATLPLEGEHQGVALMDLLRDAARSNGCLTPSEGELLAMRAQLGATVKTAKGGAAMWRELRDQLQALKQQWPFWEQSDEALMQIAEDQGWPKWAWEALPSLYREVGENVQVWADLGKELGAELKLHVVQSFSHVALIELHALDTQTELIRGASHLADECRVEVSTLNDTIRENVIRTSLHRALKCPVEFLGTIIKSPRTTSKAPTIRSPAPSPFR